MTYFIIAAAALTFAGVVGLVAMVIALYVVSAAMDAVRKRKKKEK